MIDTITRYWNEHIHDLEMTKHAVGTREFFDDLDDYRFDKLHYLPKVVDFEGFRGQALLEIGCGIGIDLLRFARGGARVTGVDLSVTAIDLATKNFVLHGLQGAADLRVGNGEVLPFPDATFDAVYAHGVVQYTSDPQRLVHEAWRVLKPGGQGIFMVYNRISWLNAMSTVMGVGLEHQDAPVLRKYSIGEFRALLEPFRETRIVPERFPGQVAAPWRREGLAVQHRLRRRLQRRASSPGQTVRLASHGAVSKVMRVLLAICAIAVLGVGIGCREQRASAPRAELTARLEPIASNAAAAAPTAVAPADPVPATVSPFPSGLSGTLVFQSDRAGRPKLYTLDLAAGRVTALTTDPQYGDENPRWSPDGRQILFKSNRAHYGASPETGQPDFDLYVMQADGSGVRRLTKAPANENEATWMPDGRSIVYSSDQDSRGDLYRLWLDDGRVERLTRHFVGRAIMPTASSDGTRVAFAAQSLNRGQFWLYQVHLLDVASGTTRALAGSGGSCWPAWAPGGGRLAYVLLDTEPSGLEAADVASGARQRLVADAKLWSYYPDWSPDGRSIAFSVSPAHHQGQDWDLALVPADGTGRITRLTTGPGNDRLPDWRP